MLVSHDAEVAVRRLGALAGFYHEARTTLKPSGLSRLRRTRVPAATAQLRTLHELAIVRCVSIIEAFAMDLGEAALSQKLSSAFDSDHVSSEAKDMVRYLRAEKWRTLSTGSWDRVSDLWKKGLGVGFPTFGAYDDLRLIRETRHAIAHRVGEYTLQYRREARKRLLALGIDPDKAAGLIPLTDTDVEDSFSVARSFVLWLDREAG